MVFELTSTELMVIFLMLALIIVMQFFKGRKLNLMLMEYSARRLEEILKPKDKVYQWIGLYVGYRAIFKLLYKTLNRVEVTITLMPRQSLLYYPIALLTTRFDRLYLVYWFDKSFTREAHVIKKGYYRRGIKGHIRNIERMRVDKAYINGKTYYLVYDDASTAHNLIKFIKSLSDPHVINHIALVPANKTLYIAAKLAPKSFEELILRSYELAKSLA